MKKPKITVLKREVYKDLVDEYATGDMAACDKFKDGQEFILEHIDMPADFCAWAWADIQRDIVGVKFGANYPWINKPNTIISCCTDGLRPVIFKIEMVDD